jgi:polyribonucleotide nucleotidyltransferase
VKQKNVQKPTSIKSLQLAHDAIRIQIKAQAELRAKKGVTTKREYKKPATDDADHGKSERFRKG